MTQTTLALNNQWLDQSTPTVTYNNNTNACAGGGVNTFTVWPNYWPTITPWMQTACYHYDGPARPIKLGLSEVERLRAAAKRDAKLKAILAKFTDLIEVTVDFE
jgi:hypothetical protein